MDNVDHNLYNINSATGSLIGKAAQNSLLHNGVTENDGRSRFESSSVDFRNQHNQWIHGTSYACL